MSEKIISSIKEQCIQILHDEFHYPERAIYDINVNDTEKQISIGLIDHKANVFFGYSTEQENLISDFISKTTGYKVAVCI